MLHLRRARSFRSAGRCRPLRRMLAGLGSRRAVRALARPAAAIVVAPRCLGEPGAQWSEGLAGLGEDEGRQDGSDQQPAFRAHCNSRCPFQRAGIRPLSA